MSIATKVDLEGLRTVSSDRGRAMAAELGLPYFETSAATGQGGFKLQLDKLELNWNWTRWSQIALSKHRVACLLSDVYSIEGWVSRQHLNYFLTQIHKV